MPSRLGPETRCRLGRRGGTRRTRLPPVRVRGAGLPAGRLRHARFRRLSLGLSLRRALWRAARAPRRRIGRRRGTSRRHHVERQFCAGFVALEPTQSACQCWLYSRPCKRFLPPFRACNASVGPCSRARRSDLPHDARREPSRSRVAQPDLVPSVRVATYR